MPQSQCAIMIRSQSRMAAKHARKPHGPQIVRISIPGKISRRGGDFYSKVF